MSRPTILLGADNEGIIADWGEIVWACNQVMANWIISGIGIRTVMFIVVGLSNSREDERSSLNFIVNTKVMATAKEKLLLRWYYILFADISCR